MSARVRIIAGIATGACVITGVVALAAPATHPPVAHPVTDAAAPGDALTASVARLQAHLRTVPGDWPSWASLGLDYVEQARRTVDPTYYPKAAAAVERSLQLRPRGNFPAMAARAALDAARHHFHAALRSARRGLRIDPGSAVLNGSLADALTQLGRYPAAARAARRMELLRPGTDAEARQSYAAELRGHVGSARRLMRLALRHAADPSDVAFTRYYLAELALNDGRPDAAVREADAGLTADPTSAALHEIRARALVAAGHPRNAVPELAAAVGAVPQPSYVLEYADLLASLGRAGAAAEQYALFRTEQRLFRANGVRLDSDATLFAADHGDAAHAVALGRRAIRSRPFLDSKDAYGWALHRAGRDRAALRRADRALRTGVHNPLFAYHRAEIEHALGRDAAAHHDVARALRWNPVFNPLLAPRADRLLRMTRRAS